MAGIATAPKNVATKVYDATDNGDGTFTIHDVELVGEMPKGDRPDGYGESPATGREWMQKVVSNHLSQLVAGYVAPVHEGHHGINEAAALGTFVPLGVKRMPVDGKEIDVLVGDVTVDAETLAGLRAGKWPYRSVEVARWQDAIVTSLAFLSGSAPYWRFPMLTSIRVVNTPDAPIVEAALATEARCSGFVDVTARRRAHALARLDAYAKAGEDGEPESEDGGARGEPGDGGDNKVEGKKEEDGGAGDESGQGDKMLAGMMALLTRIAEAVLGKKTEDRIQPTRDEDPNTSGEATGEDEDKDDEGDAKAPPKEKSKMGATTTKLDAGAQAQMDGLSAKLSSLETAHAALKAENATLVKTLADRDAAEKARVAVEAGKVRLRAKRVAIPADFEVQATKLAALGADALETLIATLESSGRQDPPETFAAELGASKAEDEVEVMAFASKGPAALESARKRAAEFRAYKAAVPSTPQTLKDYLSINVKA